jgi:hypothetical protein
MSLDIGNAAAQAAASASAELALAARTADERAMGRVARQALFTEALLGAVKAHVNELKTVAK